MSQTYSSSPSLRASAFAPASPSSAADVKPPVFAAGAGAPAPAFSPAASAAPTPASSPAPAAAPSPAGDAAGAAEAPNFRPADYTDGTSSWYEAMMATYFPWNERLSDAGKHLPNTVAKARFRLGPDGVPHFAAPLPNHDETRVLTLAEMAHLYPWFYQGPMASTTFKASNFTTRMGTIARYPGSSTAIRFWGASSPSAPLTLFVDITQPPKIAKTHSEWKRNLAWKLPGDEDTLAFYRIKEERDLAYVSALPGVVAAKYLGDREGYAEDIRMACEGRSNARLKLSDKYGPSISATVNVPYPGRPRDHETFVFRMAVVNGVRGFVESTAHETMRVHTAGVPIFEVDRRYESNGKFCAGLSVHTYLHLDENVAAARINEQIEQVFNVPFHPSVALIEGPPRDDSPTPMADDGGQQQPPYPALPPQPATSRPYYPPAVPTLTPSSH